MKTTVVLLALALTQTAHAQFIRSETAGGALLGGLAGAIIGNNSGDLGHNAWKGAAIGTVAGGLLGSAAGRSRDNYYSHNVPVPRATRYSHGYRSGYRYDYDRAGYYSSGYSRRHYRQPSYAYSSGNYSRASSGLLLGGIAGAIIGNNSGDLGNNAWRGAAIGAGSGWLLGTIADRRERAREQDREILIETTPPASASAPAQTVPQTVIINNHYYGTPSPMSSANTLFGR